MLSFSQGLLTWLTHASNYYIFLDQLTYGWPYIKGNMLNPFVAGHTFFLDQLTYGWSYIKGNMLNPFVAGHIFFIDCVS
jgi:hypothetical protein